MFCISNKNPHIVPHFQQEANWSIFMIYITSSRQNILEHCFHYQPCDTIFLNISRRHLFTRKLNIFPDQKWGRVMHICASKLTIIGSDNGLLPGRHQAIIRTNSLILLIGTLRTNFREILIEIYTFSFKKIHLKMSSGKWRPFCDGLNVLRQYW